MPRHVNEAWSEYLGPGAVPSLLVSVATALGGLGLPVLYRLRQVLREAERADAGPSDAILVLGRSLVDDRPSRVFRARLEHAVALWREEIAPRIVVTGGLTGRATRTEAEAGRKLLEDRGVPTDAIHVEDRSRHTLENLSQVRETFRVESWSRIVVVSDPLHQARVGALARGLGLPCRFSPARDATPQTRRGWWLRAVREAALLHWYHTGVLYSRLIGAESYLARVT